MSEEDVLANFTDDIDASLETRAERGNRLVGNILIPLASFVADSRCRNLFRSSGQGVLRRYIV